MKKQVIVMRSDLKMPKGKLVSQGAHASMAALLNQALVHPLEDSSIKEIVIPLSNSPLKDWLTDSFTKVVVKVNSEEELLSVYQQAQKQGLICSLIKDNGTTVFNGVPTLTCCAIGPDDIEKINQITGHLSLL